MNPVSRKEKMMDVEKIGSAEKPVVRLKGRWTIERAHELRDMLTEALNDEGPIVLDVQELTDADLSCLQLLCAAHRSSLKLGKPLALHESKPEVFRQRVREVGFARNLGCHKDPFKSCLWLGEGQT